MHGLSIHITPDTHEFEDVHSQDPFVLFLTSTLGVSYVTISSCGWMWGCSKFLHRRPLARSPWQFLPSVLSCAVLFWGNSWATERALLGTPLTLLTKTKRGVTCSQCCWQASLYLVFDEQNITFGRLFAFQLFLLLYLPVWRLQFLWKSKVWTKLHALRCFNASDPHNTPGSAAWYIALLNITLWSQSGLGIRKSMVTACPSSIVIPMSVPR